MQLCESCGGAYEAFSDDNVPYFHACAPIVILTARASDGSTISGTLDAFAGLAVVATADAAAALVLTGVDRKTIVVETGQRAASRPDARDENRDPKRRDDHGVALSKSDGKGAIALAELPDLAQAAIDAL